MGCVKTTGFLLLAVILLLLPLTMAEETTSFLGKNVMWAWALALLVIVLIISWIIILKVRASKLVDQFDKLLAMINNSLDKGDQFGAYKNYQLFKKMFEAYSNRLGKQDLNRFYQEAVIINKELSVV